MNRQLKVSFVVTARNDDHSSDAKPGMQNHCTLNHGIMNA